MPLTDSPHPYPLYNTTFTLHRLSPLYTGSSTPLTSSTLRQHARRFRDILAGEVLRGVRVVLMPEDDVLSRVGAIQAVTFRNLPEEGYWNPEQDAEIDRDDTTMSIGSNRGIL